MVSPNRANETVEMKVNRATYMRLLRFSTRFQLPLELVTERFLTQALEAVGEKYARIAWPISLQAKTTFWDRNYDEKDEEYDLAVTRS